MKDLWVLCSACPVKISILFFLFLFFYWTSVKYLVSSKTDMKEKKKKSLISEVVVKTVWSVHGCIRRTGYQSSNMAARQFLSSGPLRYCTQKPHTAQKETAVKQLTGRQQFIINLSGLLIFPKKLRAEKKSRKSPEKSFIFRMWHHSVIPAAVSRLLLMDWCILM